MLTLGLSLLFVIFGPTMMIEGGRIFLAVIGKRRAVARLYALTTEQTTRRAFHAAERRRRLAA